MRQLRELSDESRAQLVCDALLESRIDAKLMQSQRGTFGVWVVDEQKLPEAQSLCSAWLEQGDEAALQQLAQRGRATRELTARIEDRRQRQQAAVSASLVKPPRPRPTLLTWGLAVLCIAVFFFTDRGRAREPVLGLLILDLKQLVAPYLVSLLGVDISWLQLPWQQPWRLVTPMLVHFDPLHLGLNMFWLLSLGSTVEARHGARYLGVFVLLTAAFSNILQLEVAQSPMFGGLSGVVYGLLGLIWIRGRLDPQIGYRLSRGTLQLMLIWLAVGFAGEFARGLGMHDSVGTANWCHLGGLVFGVGWGYLSAKLSRR
jgi:GlpG protein